MKRVISGRTILGETQTGVFGSMIQVFDRDPSSSDAKLLGNQITNRNGEFSFRLRGKLIADAAKNQKPIYIQVFDAEGTHALSDPKPVAVVSDQVQSINLVVQSGRIANAVLPPQPRAERVIPKVIFDTIDLAIKTSAETTDVENTRLATRNYYCTLPPISNLEDILDIALGVLRGHPEDMRMLDAYLNNMEVWNERTSPGPRRRLNVQQAELLLSDDFLQDLSKKIGAAGRKTHKGGVVPSQTGITLMIAAMRIAANNPVRLHRNLGVILEQFCGLRGLDLLHTAAVDALSGVQAERSFFSQTLNLMVDFCEPDGLLTPSVPRPSPIPCGDPFWPPDPRDSTIPINPGIEDCTPGAILAFREAMKRTVVYKIDSISPPDACPGQEITIRGSYFKFEGRTGVVLFPSRPRGTKIRATPISYSDTEIRVAVPEGAACGDFELEIPSGAATIRVCDATVELFRGPSEPFRFNGGATTIEFFTSSVAGSCIESDDEVIFRWNTCNAESVTLDISSEDGTSLFSNAVEDGHFAFPVPALDRDTRVTATLVARGPCGVDEERIRFSIRRGTPLSLSDFFTFTPTPFSNWHGNHRRSVSVARPASLEQLVLAVQTAESLRQRIGVQGSAWSYTDCVAPLRTTQGLVDTAALARELNTVLPVALRSGVRSVLSPVVESELRTNLTTFSSIEKRLVHVEAGTKIHALNCMLEGKSPALALPTMGGDMGQSIAGAINTGTHGANAKLPPIADFVRAIHLVGPGAQQWWIEPHSNPVTDPNQMERLKADGPLNPCLKVVYDDRTFNACLVSVGSAGIVYSYVIEAIDAHNLSSTTTGMTWESAKDGIRRRILEPRELPELWFLEVTVNPTRHARLTTRAITTAPVPTAAPGSGPDPVHIALLGFLFGPGAIGAVPAIIGFGTGAVAGLMGALPFYIARRTAELIRYLTNPFEWPRIIEIQQEIELIQRLTDTLTSLTRAIARGARDADLAEVIPNLLNVIWQIGLYVIDGRTIVETAQNIFTNINSRPEGTTIKKSYVAMTDQTDCAISSAPPTPSPGLLPPAHHSAFVRLIESFEYALPAEQTIAFADDVLALADRVRGTNDAIIVILNLRFTQPTRALIGMQQFARATGHVEVYTVRGLAGNGVFQRDLQTIAAEYRAIPHWGQFHDDTGDFESLFGSSLRIWQEVINHLSRAGRGRLNTFRHDFALRRRLLTDL